MNFYKNIPIDSSQNIQLELLGQCVGGYRRRRRYTRAQEVEKLAIDMYSKNGRGITFNHLLSAGMASHKEQAQSTLKHCLNNKILFTISSHKPQHYYPVCLKSQISKAAISKNIPIGVTEVGCSKAPLFSANKISEHCNGPGYFAIQSLEAYVLPLLPPSPLFIHKMHFRLKINPECYSELDLTIGKRNKGKQHLEVIGKVRTSYCFYSNGTVMVFTESSNSPFKLEDEVDRSRIIAFFGQVRDRLITFLMDSHERIVPDIIEWQLTGLDVNRDVSVSDWLQCTGLKIQVKHLDHLFRIYIKSKGKDTFCRVEESVTCSNRSSAIDAINRVFNPYQRVENLIADMRSKLDNISAFINDNKNWQLSTRNIPQETK